MLFNKLERFKNLIKQDDFEGRVGESLVDTLLDMANYAVETARVMQCDLEFVREMDRLDEEAQFIVEEEILSDCESWADWGEEI